MSPAETMHCRMASLSQSYSPCHMSGPTSTSKLMFAEATAAEQTAQEESSSAQEPADDPAATVDAVAQVDRFRRVSSASSIELVVVV